MEDKTFSRSKAIIKFNVDNEELTSQDLADAIAQMHEKKRYHELLFMIDTCEAESMYLKIKSPDTISVASSKVGQPSLSHHNDRFVGVSVIDSFTNFNLETFEHIEREDTKNLKDLFDKYDFRMINSHARYMSRMKRRSLRDVKIVDFFGGVQSVELTRGDTTVIDFNATNPDSRIVQLNEDAKKSPGSDQQQINHSPVHNVYEIKRHSLLELIELNFLVGLGIFTAIVVCSFI